MEDHKKPKISFYKKALGAFTVIMLFSWMLAAWDPTEVEDSYTGIPEEQIKVNSYDFWILEDETFGAFIYKDNLRIPIAFRLDPREAEDISIDEQAVTEILSAKKIYMTFNPNEGELSKIAVASAELSRILAVFNIPVMGAYTEDTNPINPAVPLKTCDDATDEVKIILLEIDKDTSITTKDNCIHISGETEDDLILSADKLGYNLVGFKI